MKHYSKPFRKFAKFEGSVGFFFFNNLIATNIIASVVIQAIYLFVSIKKGLKKFKEKPQYEHLKAFYQALMSSASMMLLKSKIWNWYTISFVITPLFIIICPFLLPSTLFTLLKKLFGYKSKLEKKAEEEGKLMEEASIKAKEWMKNEGDMNPIDPLDEETIIPDVDGTDFDKEIK